MIHSLASGRRPGYCLRVYSMAHGGNDVLFPSERIYLNSDIPCRFIMHSQHGLFILFLIMSNMILIDTLYFGCLFLPTETNRRTHLSPLPYLEP